MCEPGARTRKDRGRDGVEAEQETEAKAGTFEQSKRDRLTLYRHKRAKDTI
jgi:hypothetical protein